MLKNKLIWSFSLLVLVPNILFWFPIILETWQRNKFEAAIEFASNDLYQLLVLIPIVGAIVMLTYSVIYKNYPAIVLSILLLLGVILEIFWIISWAVSEIGF